MGKKLTKCVRGQRPSSMEKIDVEPSNTTESSTDDTENISPSQDIFDEYLCRPLVHDYNMRHQNRGKALIFNHEYFRDPSVGTRAGTTVDRDRLQKTFDSLGFDVQTHDNLRWAQMKNILNEYIKADHSNDDCVAVIILSHGEAIPMIDRKTRQESHTILSHDQVSYIHAYDRMYPLQMLFKYFTDENCPTLKGKPRLFFIQACQGNQIDSGFEMISKPFAKKIERDGISIENTNRLEPFLPQKDFLIAYSTLPGFFSFRNSLKGSWFIQELCRELTRTENIGVCNILEMLTYVTQTVAYDYESYSNDDKFHEKKQIACVVSMLTKLVYFPMAINGIDESP